MTPYNTFLIRVLRGGPPLTALILALSSATPASGQTADTARARPDTTARPEPAARQQAPARTGTYMNIGFVALVDAGWSTARDVRALQLGDHDPRVRGFTIPNAELTLDGAVDPYFKGFATSSTRSMRTARPASSWKRRTSSRRPCRRTCSSRAGSSSPSSAARIRSTRTRGRSWTSRWCSIACSAPTASGARARGSPGWRRRRGMPRPWSRCRTAPGRRRSAFARTSHRRSTAGYQSSAKCASCRTCCCAPRVTTSFDLTATQTLLLGVSGAFGPNNSGPSAADRDLRRRPVLEVEVRQGRQGIPVRLVSERGLTRRTMTPPSGSPSMTPSSRCPPRPARRRRLCGGAVGHQAALGRRAPRGVRERRRRRVRLRPARRPVPGVTESDLVSDRILEGAAAIQLRRPRPASASITRCGCSSSSFSARTQHTNSRRLT